MVNIVSVDKNSYAERAGIMPGDILISVDSHDINDVLDYRFYIASRRITLGLERAGKAFDVEIKKQEYDDIGLEFETPLMDKKHRCENKCIFCFIDQLPKGMRKTLYFKDDDSRLSFLHGNYITMTNLRDADIERIISMHISPVNVSVHTTNPDLRVAMMHNKRAGEVLRYLRRLADAGITMHGQIVLCKGINDGTELDRTMRDLSGLYPMMNDVSVVPAGLTKYRDGLYRLEPFDATESAAVIDRVNSFGDGCVEKFGARIFCCSDEFYLTSGRELPGEEYYGDYDQIENGVGMITSLNAEVRGELDFVDEYLENAKLPRTVTIATGAAAYDCIKANADKLMQKIPGLNVNVVKIINYFFGESITVAGLLTGQDMRNQLTGLDLGDVLLIPHATLRTGEDVFLDDMHICELSESLGGIEIIPVENSGAAFISAVLGVKNGI